MKLGKGGRKAALHRVTEHLTNEFRKKPDTRISENVIVELISYNNETVLMEENKPVEEILSRCDRNRKNWINVDGLSDRNLVAQVADKFDLHHLLIEDILNVDHQPKTDELEDHLFLTMKMFYRFDEEKIDYEHISFVLGKNYLLSFQEKEGDIFSGIRTRIKQDNGIIRKRGTDYLLYRLVDTIVDSYYSVLEKIGEQVEAIEENISKNPSVEDFQQIQKIRKEFIYLRRVVYPLREAINKIVKNESGFIDENNEKYFADVYDHIIHLIDSLDTYKDLTSTMMDLYMNTINYKMNEVMKLLTIITTIFIPLSFIAGIYGMNFSNMPELRSEYGYFVILGIMGVLFILMILYFRYKKWF
jgi:magnesium transporter